MSGHTPGPWRKGARVPERHAIRILSDVGLLVAEARGAAGPWSRVEANARLIAAAPETTEALADLVEQLEGIGIPDWAGAEGLDLTKAKAAIAKAKP
jgi:hypothetical protein